MVNPMVRMVGIVHPAESGPAIIRIPAPAFVPVQRLVFWWIPDGTATSHRLEGSRDGIRNPWLTTRGRSMSWMGWLRWVKNQIHAVGVEPPRTRRPAPEMQRNLHRLAALLEQ